MVDPIVLRVMKLRKRHVRLAFERIAESKKRVSVAKCPECGGESKANYDETGYHGHHCAKGHGFIMPKSLREPHAPRIATEKADVARMPLRPSPLGTPDGMTKMRELQAKVADPTWGKESWTIGMGR